MKKNIIITLLSLILLQTTVSAEAIKFVQVTDAHFKTNDEYRAEVLKETVKGYSKMSVHDQAMLQLPYIQTTMAVFELIKLDHEIKNGQIKVKEISGMRKDRYSSIAYNFWCACQLELKLKPKNNDVNNLVNLLPIKQGYRNR